MVIAGLLHIKFPVVPPAVVGFGTTKVHRHSLSAPFSVQPPVVTGGWHQAGIPWSLKLLAPLTPPHVPHCPFPSFIVNIACALSWSDGKKTYWHTYCFVLWASSTLLTPSSFLVSPTHVDLMLLR